MLGLTITILFLLFIIALIIFQLVSMIQNILNRNKKIKSDFEEEIDKIGKE